MSTLPELVNEAYEIADEHGWHEEVRQLPELMALLHTEISEAFEEWRDGHEPTEIYYNVEKPNKPEGIPIELADLMIRVFDICGMFGIDLDEAIRIKTEYNKTRPYRHGGKRA